MEHLIESERLILRELSIEDAVDFFRLNEDPEVLKYTGDLPFESVSEAKIFLENYNEYALNGFGRWAVIDKETHQFLGWCGLKLNEEGLVDLGFRFYQNQWGKGYATEAAQASINYGLKQLGLNEIIARAAIENVASIKVLEKLNMKFWKNGICNGIPNAAYYKITLKNSLDK
ncbi:GNAT family N-acetyltransferase [Crocinitomix catalasitica]|uniref:GNAT family N-acetyltransferase n=1 Tax=Crocinitomix catalasitica TaxID=184607 RepID=UPI00048514AF|nr:GNAT family N-acetyltransferase [Crocinitomix catalasitica]